MSFNVDESLLASKDSALCAERVWSNQAWKQFDHELCYNMSHTTCPQQNRQANVTMRSIQEMSVDTLAFLLETVDTWSSF